MKINVDFNKIVGEIKPMHAVGQPPFLGGSWSIDFSFMEHLTKAKIPYSRLHDVGGAYGSNRYVDIPNLFRNFDADENDPNSYDFAFTDVLIEEMYKHELEPIFRLGVTIENQANIKAYHIHPPKDFGKWARICEHVIRHYNEGWANGFHYGIEYWEIWNEPDNNVPALNQMWTGTKEQFYELYDVTAKHLKSCFGDKIKVGGYGASGLYGVYYHPDKYGVDVLEREKDDRYDCDIYRVEFFLGFLEYIKKHNSPIDFFSWHSYANVEKTLVLDNYIHKKLTEYGYGDLERHFNEWNNAHENRFYGTSYASSANGAMLCAMQNSHSHMGCFYDTRVMPTAYSGFFAPLTYEPTCTYYAFYAFGELYTLKNQVECAFENKEVGAYVVASKNGDKKAIMLVNHFDEERKVQINNVSDCEVYLIDQDHYITKADVSATDFVIAPHQVVLIKNY